MQSEENKGKKTEDIKEKDEKQKNIIRNRTRELLEMYRKAKQQDEDER